MTKATTPIESAKKAVQRAIASNGEAAKEAAKAKAAGALTDPKASAASKGKAALTDPPKGEKSGKAEPVQASTDPKPSAKSKDTAKTPSVKETMTEATARSLAATVKQLRRHHERIKLWGAPAKELLKDLTNAIAHLEGATEEAHSLPRDLAKLARDEKLRQYNAERSAKSAAAAAQ